MGTIDDFRQEILQLEEQRVQAFLSADTATLTRLLADDFSLVHTGSGIDTKQDFIEKLESGTLNYQTITTLNIHPRIYGDSGDVGLVTGAASMEIIVRGEPRQYSYVYTAVYVKENKSWKMVAIQATRVPQD